MTQKLAARLRKYEALADDSEFRDPKYQYALRKECFMSPDYGVKNSTNGYISKAPAYRSAKCQAFYDAIDAVNDPSPDLHYIQRNRGEKDADKCLPSGYGKGDDDLRVEEWMVDPEWLKEHAKCCDKKEKIADNSIHWGAKEAPEEVDERFSSMRAEKEQVNALKRKKKSGPSGSAKKSKGPKRETGARKRKAPAPVVQTGGGEEDVITP